MIDFLNSNAVHSILKKINMKLMLIKSERIITRIYRIKIMRFSPLLRLPPTWKSLWKKIETSLHRSMLVSSLDLFPILRFFNFYFYNFPFSISNFISFLNSIKQKWSVFSIKFRSYRVVSFEFLPRNGVGKT